MLFVSDGMMDMVEALTFLFRIRWCALPLRPDDVYIDSALGGSGRLGALFHPLRTAPLRPPLKVACNVQVRCMAVG